MARAKRPSDAVQFTLESAQRIAGVIRAAELAVPAAAPLTFKRPILPERKIFRVGEFDGTWLKSTDKQVRLINQEEVNNEPVEVTVKNVLYNVFPVEPGSPTRCVIGREGSEWYLANDERYNCEDSQGAEWLSQQQYSSASDATSIQAGNGPQVLINHYGCLRWVALTARSLYVNITNPNNGLNLVKQPLWVLDDIYPQEDESFSCESLGQQVTGGTITIDYGSGTVELSGPCNAKQIGINIALDTISCPE